MLECKGNIWQMLKEWEDLIHAFSTMKLGFLWHWPLPWSCMSGDLVCQLASVDILSRMEIRLSCSPLFFFFSDTIVDSWLPESYFYFLPPVLPALSGLTSFVD